MALTFSDEFLSGEKQEPIIVYSPEIHESMPSFLSNEAVFKIFKKQFEDEIDRVLQFAKEHLKPKTDESGAPGPSSSELETVTTNLAQFKENLFGPADYDGQHKDILYSIGKTTFFAFSELLCDEGLPLEKRLDALRNLANEITGSSQTAVAALQAAIDELDVPKLVYSTGKYTKLESFLEHPDFADFRKEFEDEIDWLIQFAEDHARREGDPANDPRLTHEAIERIRTDLNTFKGRLFDSTFFPAKDKEVLYSGGKKMLFAYGRLLRSGKTPLEACLLSLPSVAEKMAVCSGGVMTELQDETDNLKAFIQPFDDKVRNLIQTFARQRILEFVLNRHGDDPAMEVHYVNRYFNYFARRIGCAPREQDRFINDVRGVDDKLLEECKEIVLAEVQPGRFAQRAAQQYLDIMTGAVRHLVSQGENIPMDQMAKVRDILEGQEKDQQGVYGEINPNSVLVSFDEVDYQVARRPTLIAVEMLEHMRKLGMLAGDEQKILVSVPEGDGKRELMTWDRRVFWIKETFVETIKLIKLPVDGKDEYEEKETGALITPYLLRAEDLSLFSPEAVRDSLAEGDEQEVDDVLRNVVYEATAGLTFSEAAAAIPDEWLRYAPLNRMLETLKPDEQEQWIALMKSARARGVNIDARNENGYTPLLVALVNRMMDAAMALVEAGADVRVTDRSGDNALALLIKSAGHDQTVERWADLFKSLIDKGAGREEGNAQRETPLLVAARLGFINAAVALLDQGADPLVKDHAREDVLSLMLAAAPKPPSEPTVEQWTRFIRQLTDKDVDINKNKGSDAPLLKAANKPLPNAFTALVDAGADLTVGGQWNALMAAVNRGADDIGVAFIERVRGDGPLTKEKASLIDPDAPAGFRVQDYALLHNCSKTIDAQAKVLFEAFDQNLINPTNFFNKAVTTPNLSLERGLGFGHVEAMRSMANFLVQALALSLIDQSALGPLAQTCRQIRTGGPRKVVKACDALLEGCVSPAKVFMELVHNSLEARREALRHGRTARIEADYKLLRAGMKSGWLTSAAYKDIVRASIETRPDAVKNGCAAAIDADNRFHLWARQEGKLSNAALKKLLAASNVRGVEIQPGSPQEAAMRAHCEAVLTAYAKGWLNSKVEPAPGWLEQNLPEAWRKATSLRAEKQKSKITFTKIPLTKGVKDLARRLGFGRKREAPRPAPQPSVEDIGASLRETAHGRPSPAPQERRDEDSQHQDNHQPLSPDEPIERALPPPPGEAVAPLREEEMERNQKRDEDEDIQHRNDREPPSVEEPVGRPPLPLPAQGEIARAMKANTLLPFIIDAGGRPQVTLTNDCGLHVLFRVDARLLQAYGDRDNGPVGREAWKMALEQLQKDLKRAIEARVMEGEIPADQAGYDLSAAGITGDLLAKLLEIREIDERPFGAFRYGLPDAPGPFEEFDDEVRRQLRRGHEEGASFALLVGDLPGNRIDIGGYVVGKGHFVTLIPIGGPAADLDQPPGDRLWILSDSLHPGGEILVTAKQIEDALPRQAQDLNRSYDLISARSASVRHTHFEHLVPGLRERIMECGAETEPRETGAPIPDGQQATPRVERTTLAQFFAQDESAEPSAANGKSSVDRTSVRLVDLLIKETWDGSLPSSPSQLDAVEYFLDGGNFHAQLAKLKDAPPPAGQPQPTMPWETWSKRLDLQKELFLTQRFIGGNLDLISAINKSQAAALPGVAADPEALRRTWLERRNALATTLAASPENDLNALSARLAQRFEECLAERDELRQAFLKDVAGIDAPATKTLQERLSDKRSYRPQIEMMESMAKAQAAWLEEKIAMRLAVCSSAASEKALGNKVPLERVNRALVDLDKSLEQDMLMLNQAIRLQADLKTLQADANAVDEAELARTIAQFAPLQSGAFYDSTQSPPELAESHERLAECLLTAQRREPQVESAEAEITQAIRPLEKLDDLKPRISDEIRQALAKKISQGKTEEVDSANIVEERVTDRPSFSGAVIHATQNYVFILVDGKMKQPSVVAATEEELGIERRHLQEGKRLTYPPAPTKAMKRTKTI